MAECIGTEVKVKSGLIILWDLESFELTLKDSKGGFVYWEKDEGANYPVTRRFIETEWQFICLADIIARTHGLTTSKIRQNKDNKTKWEIEFIEVNK